MKGSVTFHCIIQYNQPYANSWGKVKETTLTSFFFLPLVSSQVLLGVVTQVTFLGLRKGEEVGEWVHLGGKRKTPAHLPTLALSFIFYFPVTTYSQHTSQSITPVLKTLTHKNVLVRTSKAIHVWLILPPTTPPGTTFLLTLFQPNLPPP